MKVCDMCMLKYTLVLNAMTPLLRPNFHFEVSNECSWIKWLTSINTFSVCGPSGQSCCQITRRMRAQTSWTLVATFHRSAFCVRELPTVHCIVTLNTGMPRVTMETLKKTLRKNKLTILGTDSPLKPLSKLMKQYGIFSLKRLTTIFFFIVLLFFIIIMIYILKCKIKIPKPTK